ncbi:suppressor of fused domain protein [Streptomyces sp. 8N114]|uniref:suppressor of fused domain protein n=1 Tax=Streptomyces sp. 8N114 TaxID=3457419 RepID=UPI003FCF56CF
MTADNDYLDHLRRHLGEVVEREEAQDRGYGLLEFRRETPPLSTVTTDGLRSQGLTALAPVELACTLWEGQRHVARHLVDSMAQILLRNPSRLIEYGFVVENDEALLKGTQIHAVLGCPSPFFRDGFGLLKEESGNINVQTITLLPITAGEADLVRDEGEDALFAAFWEKKPNLLDVTRETVA